MRKHLPGAALMSVLVMSWVGAFGSFGVATGVAVVGLIFAPFLIFAAALPGIIRAGSAPLAEGARAPRPPPDVS